MTSDYLRLFSRMENISTKTNCYPKGISGDLFMPGGTSYCLLHNNSADIIKSTDFLPESNKYQHVPRLNRLVFRKKKTSDIVRVRGSHIDLSYQHQSHRLNTIWEKICFIGSFIKTSSIRIPDIEERNQQRGASHSSETSRSIWKRESVQLTVLCTLKSDREAISLSSSNVADVADGFAELQRRQNHKTPILLRSGALKRCLKLDRFQLFPLLKAVICIQHLWPERTVFLHCLFYFSKPVLNSYELLIFFIFFTISWPIGALNPKP